MAKWVRLLRVMFPDCRSCDWRHRRATETHDKTVCAAMLVMTCAERDALLHRPSVQPCLEAASSAAPRLLPAGGSWRRRLRRGPNSNGLPPAQLTLVSPIGSSQRDGHGAKSTFGRLVSCQAVRIDHSSSSLVYETNARYVLVVSGPVRCIS